MVTFLFTTASLLLLFCLETVPVFDDLAILCILVIQYHARAACLLQQPQQPRRLLGHADGRWTLVLNDDRRIAVRFEPGLLMSPLVVAASMKGEGRRWWILAVPWNSQAGPRRRLAVRLRWTPTQELFGE